MSQNGQRLPRAMLLVVLTATFVQLLDVTIAQVAIPSIQRELHAGDGPLQLVLAGYTLTYACLLIAAARLGDRYGYRRLFATGITVFTLGSLLCTAAPTVTFLVVARLVQGLGSGLMAPQVLSIIQIAVPNERRRHALSLLGATMGVASLAGPLLGGLLLSADLWGLGWRLVFLVNIPIGLAALIGCALLPAARGASSQPIDIGGAALAIVGLGFLILPLAVGRELGWPIWTGVSLLTAVLVLTLFIQTQRRRRAPLLHPSVLRDRRVRTGTLLVFAFNAGVPSFTYLLFVYLQDGVGDSPLRAALTSAPFAAAAIIGSRLSPTLVRRYGTTLLVGATLTLTAVMAFLAILVASGVTTWALTPLLAVGGLSFGAFTASVFTLVLSGITPEAIGSASGLLPTAQQLGGTIGVTLAGLVYYGTATKPASSFVDAMAYEVIIFLLASLIALRIRSAPPSDTKPCKPGGSRSCSAEPTSARADAL